VILLVDDAVFIRQMLHKSLSEAGFIVSGEAGDGVTALEQFRRCKPQIVLLDLFMPNMNGITTLRIMQQLDKNAKIIVCSAASQQDIVLKALRLGAVDYIPKPFQINEVVEKVRRVHHNQCIKGAALCF
jgi:two-component system, chemotaxis family, chemotaxis protein CheY